VRATLVRRLAVVQAAIDGLSGDEGAGAADEASVKQRRKPRQRARQPQAEQPTAKPASQRAPRARAPMRPAPEGA